MRQVDLHEAKARLSMLVERAVAHGESFVISKAGKPLAKVVPLSERQSTRSRIGFMRGRISVPDDFDTMFGKEIEELFSGRS